MEERYDFADALAVATYLNIFVRHCHWVKMANLAQLVNAIAPVVTTREGAYVQPIYYPFLLHAGSALDQAVDAFVDSEEVVPPAEPAGRWRHRLADLGPLPMVDAAATCNLARDKVCITLVNRKTEGSDALEVQLRDCAFGGSATVRTLTEEPDPSKRPLAGIGAVKLEEGSSPCKGNVATFTVPPRSFTVVEATITAG